MNCLLTSVGDRGIPAGDPEHKCLGGQKANILASATKGPPASLHARLAADPLFDTLKN
jgi:hypothetical protein